MPSRIFERKGDDLSIDVPVTISEAALGAQIEIPTIDGRVKLKVPAGSQDGRALRVPGKGAPQAEALGAWRPDRPHPGARAGVVDRRAARRARAVRRARRDQSADRAVRMSTDEPGGGFYMIGIMAELAGMHPQTLRLYERRGLIQPSRSAGRTRRYSDADLARLRRIQALSEAGLNIAGIERVLDLERQLDEAEQRLAALAARARGRTHASIVRRCSARAVRRAPRSCWSLAARPPWSRCSGRSRRTGGGRTTCQLNGQPNGRRRRSPTRSASRRTGPTSGWSPSTCCWRCLDSARA